MSLSIIFLYSDRGHLLTVMNLWMKNLDFIISTKINYPIPAIYFTLGLGVILFLKNCLFLFLEPGPPAKSFVTRSFLIQLFPSCSVSFYSLCSWASWVKGGNTAIGQPHQTDKIYYYTKNISTPFFSTNYCLFHIRSLIDRSNIIKMQILCVFFLSEQ